MENSLNPVSAGFLSIFLGYARAIKVDDISVFIDSRQVQALNTDYQLYDDGNRRWIYFAYPEGTHETQITAEQP